MRMGFTETPVVTEGREQGHRRGEFLVLQMKKWRSRGPGLLGGGAWQCRARLLFSVPVATSSQGHRAELPYSQDSPGNYMGPAGRQTPVRKVLSASWPPVLTEDVWGGQLPGANEGGTERLVWRK